MPQHKVKEFGRAVCQFKAEGVTEEGHFEGYGSVFKVVDSYNEIVDKGAFKESLAAKEKSGRPPKMLWQHDRDEGPIGIWDSMKEDDKGLFVKGHLLLGATDRDEIRLARDTYIRMKAGAVDEMSIGYRVVVHEFDSETEVTHLKKLDLGEVSPVTFAANSEAVVTDVKSIRDDMKSIRDFEHFLRDAGGYSRKEATAVALHGWKALEQREAGDESADNAACISTMQSLIAQLKEGATSA